MKLLRFGNPGEERPGMLDSQGGIRDLSDHVADIRGEALSASSIDRLSDVDPESLPLVAGSPRIGPCIAGIGKFMCIGLNYSDHAEESGLPMPDEPVLFAKFTSAVSGPYDNVVIPRGATKTDWEVELGVVIGTRAKYVTPEESLSYVAGYCVVNDISERAFQLEGSGQWVKGKSSDTFGPIGPWLVTRDEIPDPQLLHIWLDVNGERLQDSTTANMVFTAAYLVSYLSNFFTLEPGDIISTGTPPGVGLGFKPPRYLSSGDTMRLGIDGLGEQQARCVDDPA